MMNSDQLYDEIVVGGGISGILSALALGKHGKKVLLVEQEGCLGGNCRTYEPSEYPGWRVDTGIHAITELSSGPLIQMKEYFDPGKFPEFEAHGSYLIRGKNGVKKFPSTLKEFLKLDNIPTRDKIILAEKLLGSMMSRMVSAGKETSVYDLISKHNLDKRTIQFVDALSYLLSGLSMKKTSVSRFLDGCGFDYGSNAEFSEKLTGLWNLFVKNSEYDAQGYPKGGIQKITDGAAESFPKNVEYHVEENVFSIKNESDVFFVSTSKGDYSTKNVVYSGPVQALPKIIEMPKEWTDHVAKLEKATAMTIWYGLSKPLDEFNYNGSEVFFDAGDDEVFYWLMPVPELAPRGKGLIGVSTIINPNESGKYEKLLQNTLYSVVPGIKENIEMYHVQIMQPEKAAASLTHFPGVETPVKGLYVVGTDTDMRSMGVTRAAYSVLELLKSKNLGNSTRRDKKNTVIS